MVLDFDGVDEFTEIGGVHAQVGGEIFLRNHAQQVSTARHKSAKACLHIKGHEFVVALHDAVEEAFGKFAE